MLAQDGEQVGFGDAGYGTVVAFYVRVSLDGTGREDPQDIIQF